jgi:hypothetical protein
VVPEALRLGAMANAFKYGQRPSGINHRRLVKFKFKFFSTQKTLGFILTQKIPLG